MSLPADHHPQFEAKCASYCPGKVVYLETNARIANPTNHGSPHRGPQGGEFINACPLLMTNTR